MHYERPWYQKFTEWFLILLMAIGIGVVGFMMLFLVPALLLSERVQIGPCSQIVEVGGCDRHGYCAAMLANGQRHIEHMPVVGQCVCPSVCGWPIRWLNVRSDRR
jgi:hypothetical protein